MRHKYCSGYDDDNNDPNALLLGDYLSKRDVIVYDKIFKICINREQLFDEITPISINIQIFINNHAKDVFNGKTFIKCVSHYI